MESSIYLVIQVVQSYLCTIKYQNKKIKHILVRHEQGAGHAAEGYARSSGKPGIILVTSGPGATNTVTALTDAYMDSVPLVCITGQVPTHLIGTDAFQECDTTGITRPCTKHNWLIKDVNKIAETVHKAFHIATTGRPGPVLIDIPKDIQFQKGVYKSSKEIEIDNKKKIINSDLTNIEKAVEMIVKSSKTNFLYRWRCDKFWTRSIKSIKRISKAIWISSHFNLTRFGRDTRRRSSIFRDAWNARHIRSK